MLGVKEVRQVNLTPFLELGSKNACQSGLAQLILVSCTSKLLSLRNGSVEVSNALEPVLRYCSPQGINQKNTIATIVGGSAPRNNPSGLMPSFSNTFALCKIPMPAGFGALAITVNPPPATAPATRAYFSSSEMPSTNEPRYVSAALSVIAVSPVAPKNRALPLKLWISGLSQ